MEYTASHRIASHHMVVVSRDLNIEHRANELFPRRCHGFDLFFSLNGLGFRLYMHKLYIPSYFKKRGAWFLVAAAVSRGVPSNQESHVPIALQEEIVRKGVRSRKGDGAKRDGIWRMGSE